MRWEHTATIEAPVDVVWRLTTDVEKWPAIMPTVTRVVRLDDGPIQIGSRARIKQPGQTEAVWTVTSLRQGQEFTWQTTRMGLTIAGSHLLEQAGDHCRNTLAIELRGPGAPLLGLLLGRMFRRVLTTENASFRTAARQPA